ncbi:hypothetical protein [Deinococcus puniceus]|uniref:Outer membrane protein beta-barrel domain-containing protein n=1 Tax=Deinococcus puniceus TaxID=1182568 RepID=A0A172T9A7_9DEIO|nr:hypothetical protein [Deinococcus puniceus]ANE43534.1 hypothetical protein SU48_06855 [Deinococcus puniceus]
MMKLLFSALSLVAVLGSATAQTARVPAQWTVWSGLNAETVYLPGISLGISRTVGQLGALDLSVRGVLDVVLIPASESPVPLPAPLLGADLLFSGPVGGVTVYGGSGIGTFLGDAFWLSGTAGLRDSFGEGQWGYFGEVKARYSWAQGGNLAPGVRLGVTYRF